MTHRFGYQHTGSYERDVLIAAAHAAESLGYDELWSSDHFGQVDPFIPLATVAEATTTLNVGSLVLNNEFHNPAMVARSAATLQMLSGGRFVLGMGTGYMQSEHDAIGIELRAPKERVDRFEECLLVLHTLLAGEPIAVDGHHVDIDVESLGVDVATNVPILIGGHGRRVVTLAGRFADIFQFTGLIHGEGGAPSGGGFAMDDIVERNDWFEQAAGDRIGSTERSALVQVTHIGDPAEVNRGIADRTGLDVAVIEECPFVLAGSVEQVVDKIGRIHDQVGITHWVVRDPEGFAPVLDALR